LLKITYSILIKGRVQGIGFRPFIYRTAKRLEISGFVKNTDKGVLIYCQGKNSNRLINVLKTTPPPLSHITKLSVKRFKSNTIDGFRIIKSTKSDEKIDAVQIMPDLAICKACIKDIENKDNRRFCYPFTNCTQCGPRYSIIYSLPYDRPNTTMKEFDMCQDCLNEYINPKDRRFHAQPNACSVCGPSLTLTDNKGRKYNYQDDKSIIIKTQNLLAQGKIIAIKSVGGFLIACDAKNDISIRKLRKRKFRPSKPFAIMCKDIETVAKICVINREEVKILESCISPIVLLQKKQGKQNISQLIAPDNGYLGVMLPYTPLHKLLFTTISIVSRETIEEGLKSLKVQGSKDQGSEGQCPMFDVLVMTSANPKNEPILSNSAQVQKKLGNVVDYILDHNRKIESRCDDSIVIDYKGPIIIRRSRGYVPEPIILNNIQIRPVIAFGSDYKNHFAIGKGDKVYLSPYVGDLNSGDSIQFFFEMINKYTKWFGIKPEIVACDLHPDYTSRRLAEQYANENNLKLIKIQHHYAHLAGVMAEHGLKTPVIGVGFDGTGFGTDGKVWGSEILVLDYSGFERIAHLNELPLVGGDVEITNPKHLAQSYLSWLGIKTIKKFEIQNSKFKIQTTSMGRLFDAVASILGICHKQTFEGEAPIALQNAAMKGSLTKFKRLSLTSQLDPKIILEEVIELKKQDVSVSEIARIFHQRIIDITKNIVIDISRRRKIKSVVLSGGVFQNKIILHGIYSGLAKNGLKVFFNRQAPINDGGISLGQAVLAGIFKTKK